MSFSISPRLENLKILNEEGVELSFDGFFDASTSYRNVITEAPLLDGTILNDAIHKQPIVVNLTIFISDFPNQLSQGLLETPTTFINSFGVDFAETRSYKELNKLIDFWKKTNRITVERKYEVYKDYAIQSIDYSDGRARGVEVNMVLREIQGTSEVLTQTFLYDRLGL